MEELKLEEVTTHWCPACKGWMVVKLHPHALVVSKVRVNLNGMPLLHCESCKTFHLPHRTKDVIRYFVEQALKTKKSAVEIKPTGVLAKRFPFGKVDFLYSALDHDFIPGLSRPWNDGFLTPVFFNAAVLNKYSQDPRYKLDLFSDSYGSIIKDSENIPFGINRTGKVLMWLGDISNLPEAEQHYLRSENVESDHDVCSEFYGSQIECEFSEPSIENHAIRARSNLNDKCKKKLGDGLYQLHGEIGRVIGNLRRPLFWQDKDVAPAAESFNRIMVESLNVTMLRGQVAAHTTNEELKGLKGLKLLELWASKSLKHPDAKSLMLPFFVLYDFRVLTCHLSSDDSREKVIESINVRLNLTAKNAELEPIYQALLPKITASLKELSALLG